MLIFQYASNTDGINYVRLPLFEPLFRPRGISLALPRHLRYASEAIQGALEKLQETCGCLLMQLTGQRRRPTRIKIDKLRILYNFPGKQYVEKAPATFTPAPKPPFTQETSRHLLRYCFKAPLPKSYLFQQSNRPRSLIFRPWAPSRVS